MGKHKKHGHKSSSSSSSSSSDSSDDEYRHLPKHERKRMKKLKKQMKKGKIPPGSVPGMYPGGHHGAHGMPHGAHGMPHGAHGMHPGAHGMHPGAHGAHGAYPGQPGYPPAGGYPTGMAPPPAGYAPPPGGYPAGGAGYPAPNPSYPAQAPQGYPHPGAAGAGGFVAPGGNPPPGTYPQNVSDPVQQGGQPGYAPPPAGQPGYAPPPAGQPGYAPPPAGQPGYAPPPAGQPGYAPPPAGQPGYAPPPAGQPGYAPPPAGQPGAQGTVPPGQMPPGATDQTARQFQQMDIHGNKGVPRPTIRASPNFSAEKDAEIIRKAMKGAGTDEQAIIGVISQRSNQQRVEIARMFKTMYGKDLIKDLESELSGDFRETIMAMFKPTTFYDAWSLHKAISGAGTKENVLIEVLCTRTNGEIREINNCYKEHYKRSLEKDIVDDTSGHFKRLLVSCCQANRAELTPDQWQKLQQQGPEAVVDRSLAQQDAQALFQAGEKKMGTDESAFLQVLAVKHVFQLRATFEEYVKISGRDILNSISREMSGDLKEGFKAIVMSAKNRPEYFADKLYHALKGAGTQDSTLIRIVVSRSEIDLQDIKEVFLNKYQKTLATMVASDTSGDYKRLLLALIGQ